MSKIYIATATCTFCNTSVNYVVPDSKDIFEFDCLCSKQFGNKKHKYVLDKDIYGCTLSNINIQYTGKSYNNSINCDSFLSKLLCCNIY